jgi:hypothetical protein
VGRNLALPNSFFLNFTNNSSSEFTFYLFNQGGALQTPITSQQNLSTITNLNLSSFIDTSGNLLANTTFEVFDSSLVLLSTTSLLSGQNISLASTGLNPITGTNGKTGLFQLAQLESPNQKLVNISVGSANAGNFRIFQTSAPFATLLTTFSQKTTSFVTANPLISIEGTIPYNEILNSETGNAYKVIAMDIYSNQSNQLLQDLNYGMKDVNGDKWIVGSSPTIDPYQPSIASIQSVDTQGFTIDSETLFYYAINAYTFVRITFNYVRAQLSVMKSFDQAFVQQLTMESNKLQRTLNLEDRERYILYQ